MHISNRWGQVVCGIFAIAWQRGSSIEGYVNQALPMLGDRGKDAWGYAFADINNESKIIIRKFTNSINSRKSRIILKNLVVNLPSNGWLVIHSRLATSGFSGFEPHNHPIQFGSITLVHNGLVTGWPNNLNYLVNEKLTDSQIMARALDAVSEDEGTTLLKELRGEVNAVWYDLRNGKLRTFTNVQGLYKYSKEDISICMSEPLATLGELFHFSKNTEDEL